MDGGRAPFAIHDRGGSLATFLIVSEPEQVNSAKCPPFCAKVCVALVRAAVCGANLGEPWQILRNVGGSAKISLNGANVYITAGSSAGIDLALAWVEEDCRAAVAHEVARELVLFLRRPSGQSQYRVSLAAQASEMAAIRELQVWVAENFRKRLSVQMLPEMTRGWGHFAVVMRSDQFLQELIMRVRPLAVGR